MSPHLSNRPPAREAGPELLVLAKWEEHGAWLFQHAARWPKSARFTFCTRVQDLVLEVAELLVVARYEPGERRALLRRANLLLERLRVLLRMARATGISAPRGFESALRGIDEVGRMLHGWRERVGAR